MIYFAFIFPQLRAETEMKKSMQMLIFVIKDWIVSLSYHMSEPNVQVFNWYIYLCT